MTPLFALLAGAVFAQEPDRPYYHPDDVAARSKLFAAAARTAAPAFQAAQDDLNRLGSGLEALELSVAMLGSEAAPELAAWATGVRRLVTGRFIQIQRHVDLLQSDYQDVFQAAVDRAIPGVAAGEEVTVCGATGVAALVGRNNCQGTDINAELAAAVDQDPALESAIEEINAIAWPQLGVEERTWAPVSITGAERWVGMAPLARAFAGEAIDRHRDDLDRELAPLEERIEAGDDAAMEQAARHRERYEAALASDGLVLREALAAALSRGEKKGGPTSVGLCANPPELGGCEGEDVTAEVLEMLREDRRFGKAVAGL